MSRSFEPPRRVLMGPGPSDVSPRVLTAMARPTLGHLDPAFIGMMDELKELLQATFQTRNPLTLPISAPGSAGMEACFANLIEPGDRVVVCINGVFGARMRENVERMGAEAIVVEDPWGGPVDPDKVETTLRGQRDVKALAFVHAETSTGARSDAARLCALAHDHGALAIMDAVTSLGGIEVDVDGWGADAVYSGTQKCLSVPPGISPVTFSERAEDVIRARNSRVQSWFLDLNLVMGYWGEGASRAYHHTAPINALYALHEGLLMLQEEGLQAAWARHERHHRALRAGLEALGMELVVDAEWRLPQLNAVRVPRGIDEAAMRGQLLADYGLEIGAGLGEFAGRVWRIGLMGHGCSRANVMLCVSALETALRGRDADLRPGLAARTAAEVLDAA